MQLDELLNRQQQSWNDDAPISIETFLAEEPSLQSQADTIVDLIYAEILIRESRGERPSKNDYVSRFPDLQESIERQFQVHRAFQESEPQETPADRGHKTISDGRGKVGLHVPTIPGFDIQEMLGKGGSGVAWKAHEIALDRTVAIKYLLDVEDETNIDRLTREASAAAKLVHPSIVQVFQVGEAEGAPFLVMEYVAGGSLAEKLRPGPLSVESAVSIATDIVDAIEYAHANGVVHRDIKPGNILLGRDGRPHVCDFGLARKLDAEYSLHKTGDVLGTPAYMSPEQARGDHADARSDVYSIGAVLYESLCGRSPFQAASPWEILYQVTTSDPLPLKQLNPLLPVELETICQKCLDKNPARRYQTAAELAADLQRFSDGKPVLARPVSGWRKFSKWCNRNRTVVGLASVSILLLSTLAIGSTVAAFQLSASNAQVIEERKLAEDAQQKAINDRTVAIESLSEMVLSFYDQMVSKSMPLEMQEEVAVAALEGLRKITKIDGDVASITTAVLAKQRIGEIQAQRGLADDATREFIEGLDMARECYAVAPDDFDRGYCLVKMLNCLSLHYVRLGNVAGATPLLEESKQLLDRMMVERPDDFNLVKRWIATRTNQMDLLWLASVSDKAIEIGLESLKNVERLHEVSSEDSDALQTINQFYVRLGRAYLNAAQLDESEKYSLLAIEAIEQAIANEPERTELLATAAVTEKLYAMLLGSQCRVNQAIEAFDRGLEKANMAAELNPDSMILRAETANLRALRAAAYVAIGSYDAAVADFRRAITIYEEKLALAPDAVLARRTLLAALRPLSDVLTLQLEFSDAKQAANRMLEILDGGDGVEPLNSESDKFERWFAQLTINSLGVVTNQPMVDPTPEHVFAGLFMVAFEFSDRSSADELDEDARSLVRELVSAYDPGVDSGFEIKTVPELFAYGRTLPLTHPAIVSSYPLFESRIYARQAKRLSVLKSDSKQDNARIELLHERSLDILEPMAKMGRAVVNQIYMLPDFSELRKTDSFEQRGMALVGADL